LHCVPDYDIIPSMINDAITVKGKMMRCNQCEAMMINGVFCHETGCPNSPLGCKRKCMNCLVDFIVQDKEHTDFCSDDCKMEYWL